MMNLHSLNLDRTRANVRCKIYLQGKSRPFLNFVQTQTLSLQSLGLEYLRPFRVSEPANEDESSDSSDQDGASNGMVLL